jgi:hypothetical protein
MGLEMGARKLEGKCYNLVSEEPFKDIDFIDGTDLRCTQQVRYILSNSGIKFGEIDGFIAIKADKVPELLSKIILIRTYLPSEYHDIHKVIVKFLEVCIKNKFDITIG